MPTSFSSTSTTQYFTSTTVNPEPAWPFASTTPQKKQIVFYCVEQGGVPDYVYLRHARWPHAFAPTKETVKRLFVDTQNPLNKLVAWEEAGDYEQVLWSGQFGTGDNFVKRRAIFLVRKEQGKLHPTFSDLHVMDKVHWVEDDPHPVDGAPTLFTDEGTALEHARRCFPTLSAVEQINKVKSRKVFTFEPN